MSRTLRGLCSGGVRARRILPKQAALGRYPPGCSPPPRLRLPDLAARLRVASAHVLIGGACDVTLPTGLQRLPVRPPDSALSRSADRPGVSGRLRRPRLSPDRPQVRPSALSPERLRSCLGPSAPGRLSPTGSRRPGSLQGLPLLLSASRFVTWCLPLGVGPAARVCEAHPQGVFSAGVRSLRPSAEAECPWVDTLLGLFSTSADTVRLPGLMLRRSFRCFASCGIRSWPWLSRSGPASVSGGGITAELACSVFPPPGFEPRFSSGPTRRGVFGPVCLPFPALP